MCISVWARVLDLCNCVCVWLAGCMRHVSIHPSIGRSTHLVSICPPNFDAYIHPSIYICLCWAGTL